MTVTADPNTWGDEDLLTERPLPPASRLARLRGTVRGRGVVPTPLALAATGVLYRTATRLRSGKRAEAEAAMRAVLPPGTPESEVRRLAPHHVAAMAQAWELTWRPADLAAIRVRGDEHLYGAAATGRGVLVSFVHVGPEVAWVRAGGVMPMLLGIGEWLGEPTPPGYNGLQVEHRRRLMVNSGLQLVIAASSVRRMLAVLKVGGAVLLAMDVPGPTMTRFLGKDVEMADGTTRLAFRTRALVVPGNLVCDDDGRWALEFLPPLDPADFADPDTFQQSLADVHSAVVERAPEHYASPLRTGFWGHADSERWTRA